MAWRCSGSSNAELVSNLKARGLYSSKEVEQAMLAVDRGYYCARSSSGEVSRDAYYDAPASIGSAATISAPHMHAMALEYLKDHLKPGMSALDIGSGSGYLLTCMAAMVHPEIVATVKHHRASSSEKEFGDGGDGRHVSGLSQGQSHGQSHHRDSTESKYGDDKATPSSSPSSSSSSSSSTAAGGGDGDGKTSTATSKTAETNRGVVVGIEHIQALVDTAEANFASDPVGRAMVKAKVMFNRQGDGREGCEEYAPYDAIHVGAAAATIPQPLLHQLRVGGKMIIPVGPEHGDQYLMSVTRTDNDSWSKKIICGVRYVPLTDQKHQMSRDRWYYF